MTKIRKEDGSKYRNWFRTDRLFEDQGNWFFYTREGTIEGPYASQALAQEAIEQYVAFVDVEPTAPSIATEEQRAS